ncbi:class I adenylate-forming enzyme family protein [Rhodococcus sp. NPDC056960]|uniref:class I adenylate-forming enzyme family protein n=1 Tax=Rhodococcus TaxID=1827 RepID=UPI00362E8568
MTVSADPDFEDQVRAYHQAGYWDHSTLVTAIDHWAEVDPGHPYISDGTSTYSYGEFRRSAWNLAGGLVGLGVRSGDRVVVQLPNWNEFFLVYAAIARIGAVMVPVVSVYREHEVQFIVENSEAVGLITAGEFRGFDHAAMGATIAAAVPSVSFHVTVRAGSGDGRVDLAALLAAEHDTTALPPVPAADDPHLILYSSGTESRPKGCLHTWNTAAFLPKQAVPVLGMVRSDVMFVPSPVAHTLGLTLGVMAPTIAGAQAHLLDAFSPAAALERIDGYHCTGTASPAPFIRMLLDAYDPAVHDVSRLRFWLTAGAAIPASLVQEAQDRLSGCRVVSAYGSSEIMMATVCRPEDSVERVATSDGAPVPGVELRIVDFDEKEAVPGTDGEIRYRGPGRMLEYWGRPELTAEGQDTEGWWRTGDLGRIDEHGYLRVTGRIKDIIIRGGFNISAREVEEALLLHPAVADVAVVGLPDDAVGERACAVVVARDDTRLTVDDLRRHLAEEHKIAVWKVPERVEYVDEFPRTATGKIQKFALRAKYGDRA